ncbi:MAG: ribosome biogenesis GTPase Der [Chromatiales bacterium]|nr:ribosome biogenesis GTPase Der [Chromatiales bacterium]
MLAVVALVGRPNVGKSTLFNRLTASRDALVADEPGLTRDRRYGVARRAERPFIVVDTGGLSGLETGIDLHMARQARVAIAEADVVVLLLDAREEPGAQDLEIVAELRRAGKPVILAANKTDGIDPRVLIGELHALGLGEPLAIAAAHGSGIAQLLERIDAALPADASTEHEDAVDGVAVAVIGRPNVGKSTLINRIVGAERVIAYDQPGTTRDAIDVPFERDGQRYTLIDTAGVRRRSHVESAIEKFSVIKALQAIEKAQVVLVVLDAHEGVTEQDQTILGMALDRGRALVVAVNKWDGLRPDARDNVRRELDLRLGFVRWAPVHFISALHGSGVGELFETLLGVHAAAGRTLATPALNDALAAALTAHQPPLQRGRRVRLRYAHQGGRFPPVIVIHGTQADRTPANYRRYLENHFRESFRLHGTPIRLEFRGTENPYASRAKRRPKPSGSKRGRSERR